MSKHSKNWMSPNTKKVLDRFEKLAGRPATVLNTMSVAEIQAKKKELELQQQHMDEVLYDRFEKLTGRKPIAAMTNSEKLRYISQKEKENKSHKSRKSGGRKTRARKTRARKSGGRKTRATKRKICNY
jgi:hypothetical protein